MRKIKIQPLTLENFAPYGRYADMLNPCKEHEVLKPTEFYPDKIVSLIPGVAAGFSVNRSYKRPFEIVKAEFHDNCSEVILPLDGDVLIHVAPPTGHDVVPYDQFEVFRIPRGTAVVLNPGVWHHAPYCIEGEMANVLIVLPERTYAKDCVKVVFPEDQKIAIEGIE